ncbi:response regulator [Paenibacillus sedimenti]|uniref:Response regulator n=1 Tax=Paenibacillus sedimenti TaxID=2770274 RepID=A0A926QHN4_9BACL|nr:response regulator [Paenibacillus sedimenti]MBD0378714.1 response regulator [Paenibacillus sedimenti]
MYKIIIADDEDNVREGIRDSLQWEDLGFELVGDFVNGRDVLQSLEQLQPDVVLTDINMPLMDGLEVTRYLFEHYPQIKIIILTGYDEFEYAQQALKLKVHDYILKPNTAEELSQILSKVKADLDDENRKVEDLSKLKQQLRESLPLVRERFLNQLVTGELRESKLGDKLAYLDIDLPGSYYVVAVIDVDDHGELQRFYPESESELLYFAVCNIAGEIISRKKNGIVFQNNNEKTIAILFGGHIEALREEAVHIFEEINRSVREYLKFTVSIGVGDICNSLNKIHHSHKKASHALDYRFFLGKNRIIHIGDIEGGTGERVPYDKHWERKLATTLKSGTQQEIEGIIEKIIENLKESYLPMDRCYIHIQQIIVSILDVLDDLEICETLHSNSSSSPLTEIYGLKTLDEVEDWLKNYCLSTTGIILETRNNACKIQALKAEGYIKENYADANMSMDMVCKYLVLSTSYFSLIFKNHTGETFISYLTRIRVEKAKELLKCTDLKTYEIANRIGYADPHYFNLIFKKATGMTPTVYRRMV